MKILIVVLTFFLVACSPSLVNEKPYEALEYAHSLIDLKVQISTLEDELEQAEKKDNEYLVYKKHILPELINKNQQIFLKEQKEYLTHYAEYETKVAATKKLNKETELSVQLENDLLLEQYNTAITIENNRIIALNKSLKAEYEEKIQQALPKQEKRIKEMKAYEKRQLEESVLKNREIHASLKQLISTTVNSEYGKKKLQEAKKDFSVYSADFPFIYASTFGMSDKTKLQAKSVYESTFRSCVKNLSDRNCKRYAGMAKRGALIIPKLYSDYEFKSAMAANIVSKVILKKAKFIEEPILKEADLISEPAMPIEPVEIKEPKTPYTSQKIKIDQLKESLLTISKSFLRLNNIAVNKGLEVNWDDALHEMTENGYWQISEHKIRDDALLIIIKNNLM